MKKKKPNYKLRRNVAKIVLIMLIIIPIIIINRVKIINLTVYLPNMKYSKVIDSMFKVGYDKDEVKTLLNTLKKDNKINDNTKDYILKLHDIGYSKKSISYLLDNLKKNELTEFLNRKLIDNFDSYITNNLFKFSKLDRYLKYKQKKKLTVDQAIYRVELNLDKEYYTDSTIIKNPNDITVLTNKYLEIPEDYLPDDLVDMADDYANNMYGQLQLRKEAYDEFVRMVDDAKKEDINFYAESAYRDYEYQEIVYQNYLNENGEEKANKYAAKPGFSEHELGLAIDLANIWTIEETDKEYKWIEKNGYKYGYIFRYKKQWEDITGYAAESWHIRYVGVDVATDVHNKNMSYEEYYIKYLANKKNK